MGSFEVKNNIALTVTVCIASFEAIGELQRERLHHSRAAAFTAGMDERVDNSCKRRVLSLLPHYHLHRVWSVASIFYTGEVGVPRRG